MARDYKQLFAILKKLGLNYKDIVAEFTEGRTESLKALSEGEFKELMIRINRHNEFQYDDAANKMRRKIIGMARDMRWIKPNPAKRGEMMADMERIDNWCIKYGKYNKSLNKHSIAELANIVTAFEKAHTTFLGSLQK